MLICAMQYMPPENAFGLRYKAPIVITKKDSDVLAKTPLEVTEFG